MKNKNLIKLFASLGIIVGVGVGVGVFAYIAKPNKIYEVNLKSKTDSRYLVTEMNTQQNKADFTKKDIFDVIDNEENKKTIAKFLNINDSNNIIATIKKTNENKYKNGLEKLIYDLIRAKENGDELTLKIQNKNVKFDSVFLKLKYDTKEEKNIKIDQIALKLNELFFTPSKEVDMYILVNKNVVKFEKNHLNKTISDFKK